MFKGLLKKAKGNSLLKSMSLNLMYKPVGMIIIYVYTPLLIKYLGDERYGIWATLLSIINWIYYFDVGIGNGLRNVIARDIEEKKFEETKMAVSTAYRVMTYITVRVLVLALLLGSILNWNAVFNTDINASPVVLISFTFICINLLLSLFKVEYYAIHKSEAVALSGIIIQLINLAGLMVLSRIETDKLASLAVLFGLSSLTVNVVYSLKLWRKCNYLKPSWTLYDKSKLKEICGLGIKFFFLQISALILFTTNNLIITALYGPEMVTPYDMVYKVFNIFSAMFMAMTIPLWSKYTVAKVNNDYAWIKKTLNRMTLFLIPIGIAMAGAVVFFQPFSDWWLGKHLIYQSGLVTVMAVYMFLYIYSSIYGNAMNGMGNINLQIVVAVSAAAVNIPLSIYLAKWCGLKTVGICLAPLLTMAIANIIYTIHVKRIIRKELKKTMKVVLLAGGLGTRISEESEYKPKPMIEIGGMPIIWHIMKLYSSYGYNQFIICAGYKQDVIKEWFADYFLHTSDITFDFTKGNEVVVHNKHAEQWKVTVVDTGFNTMTGGRLMRIKEYIGDERFFVAYGDGVGDIDIDALLKFHKSHGKLATISSAILRQRFGVLDVARDGAVRCFKEKMDSEENRINIGFMVLEPEVLDMISGDDVVFEKYPLEKLAADRQLMAYKHNGFWQCMDTKREKDMLENMWMSGQTPWKVWKD